MDLTGSTWTTFRKFGRKNYNQYFLICSKPPKNRYRNIPSLFRIECRQRQKSQRRGCWSRCSLATTASMTPRGHSSVQAHRRKSSLCATSLPPILRRASHSLPSASRRARSSRSRAGSRAVTSRTVLASSSPHSCAIPGLKMQCTICSKTATAWCAASATDSRRWLNSGWSRMVRSATWTRAARPWRLTRSAATSRVWCAPA